MAEIPVYLLRDQQAVLKWPFWAVFSLKADHDMNIVREILSPLIAVIAAFIVGGLIIALLGDNPFEAYGLLLSNSFGSIRDIGWTLHLATPLIFTGLAVAVAFRATASFQAIAFQLDPGLGPTRLLPPGIWLVPFISQIAA